MMRAAVSFLASQGSGKNCNGLVRKGPVLLPQRALCVPRLAALLLGSIGSRCGG